MTEEVMSTIKLAWILGRNDAKAHAARDRGVRWARMEIKEPMCILRKRYLGQHAVFPFELEVDFRDLIEFLVPDGGCKFTSRRQKVRRPKTT
jgi:hypothetical protein